MRNDAKSESSSSVSGSGSGSGLRRSTRSTTNPSPPSVRKSARLENQPEKIAEDMGEKTLREIADETRGSTPTPTPKLGLKRKKRLDARQFKALFDLKNTPLSTSKKRRLQFNAPKTDQIQILQSRSVASVFQIPREFLRLALSHFLTIPYFYKGLLSI
ncbi:hypothetical protein KSS87_023647 [Heliosperma pusillum]|nr:hypothetical protein KSS87_023647 [Heliosperma pusillum]